MMKKSVFVKSCSGLFLSAVVVGGMAYSHSRSTETRTLDLSAFSNLAANVEALSQKNDLNSVSAAENEVEATIIAQIDSEIKYSIRKSRVTSFKPKKVQAAVAKKVNYEKVKVEIAASEVMDSAIINNTELVKLYAFSADQLTYSSFANLSWDLDKVAADDVIRDEVTNSLASTNVEADAADDMVMFDYSKSEATPATEMVETKTASRKMFDSPLSKSVKAAIAREVAAVNTHKNSTEPVVPAAKSSLRKEEVEEESLDKIMEDEDNIIYDYSKQTASSSAPTTKEAISAFMATPEDQATEKEFTIKAREINLNTQKIRAAIGYEFVPDYDRAERIDDGANGEIKVAYSLTGELNTQTGVIQAQGMIPTRVELNLAESGMTIPLINEEGIQQFLMKRKMDIQGNLALFAIDPSIKDIELDSSYEAKLFFTKAFKQVGSIEAADYIMFLGVQTGNTLLRYLLSNKETAQKIIHVGDGEMFFEDSDFVNTQRELYTFTTRSLLGRKSKELNIDGSQVGIFGTKTTSKKKALNAYEIKVPEMIAGSRKYLEFTHMPTTLYVGTEDETSIEIPGMDFIKRVLQANDMDELGQRCIVQVNLAKDIRDLKVNGKNKAGEMFTETSFLDNDGNFSTDNPELSEKIFFIGDMEGQFNAKLEYTDGSTQFLKTYCSEGKYIVEQL